MEYDLMLLADPGTARSEVLRVLSEAPDIRPDPQVDTRFWLETPHGEAKINIGTKDPVESIHVELEFGEFAFMDAVADRSLTLADAVAMRVEDVQWGHEVTAQNLDQLKGHWRSAAPSPPIPAARPRWRFW